MDPLLLSLPAKLVATPDNTAPGSEGRLYIQFPEEFAFFVGKRVRSIGHMKNDGCLMLVVTGDDGMAITPRRQLWWKNGVRDHGIRENWNLRVFLLDPSLVVLVLKSKTGEVTPKLPPAQDRLFT